jgi:hypothetical protein
VDQNQQIYYKNWDNYKPTLGDGNSCNTTYQEEQEDQEKQEE